MACGAKEAGGVYRPRHPQQTPFYQLVERFTIPKRLRIYFRFERRLLGDLCRAAAPQPSGPHSSPPNLWQSPPPP